MTADDEYERLVERSVQLDRQEEHFEQIARHSSWMGVAACCAAFVGIVAGVYNDWNAIVTWSYGIPLCFSFIFLAFVRFTLQAVRLGRAARHERLLSLDE